MVDPGNSKSGRAVLPEFMYRLQRQAGIAGKVSVYAPFGAGFAGYKIFIFSPENRVAKLFWGRVQIENATAFFLPFTKEAITST